MRNRFFSLILLMAVAYGCGSAKIEETVTYKYKEPVGSNYRPKKIYKKPSVIEGIANASSKETKYN